MNIDYTITIGNIIEIVSIVGGGVLVLWTLKSDVSALKTGAESLRNDLWLMQGEIKKLGEILVNLADIRGDLKTLSARISATEQDIRDLRHGDGFIRGNFNRSVDAEYPKSAAQP